MKPSIASMIRRMLFVSLLTLFASSVLNAEQVKGSFTLPFDAYWGDILLPAGHYTFSLDTTGANPVVIHPGLRSRYVKFGFSEALHSPAKSQLVIVHTADRAMVNAVYISELKTAFWFKVPEKYSVTHRVIADSKPTPNLDFVPVTVNGK